MKYIIYILIIWILSAIFLGGFASEALVQLVIKGLYGLLNLGDLFAETVNNTKI